MFIIHCFKAGFLVNITILQQGAFLLMREIQEVSWRMEQFVLFPSKEALVFRWQSTALRNFTQFSTTCTGYAEQLSTAKKCSVI
ncbi:hypothetical protein ANCCAN_00337 [Ancylostoma caninum]|uniref:Uncharacterized protein n=1 Tax=Ancylostoma caninum TaxID=29170 RepID=A0A368H9Q5_ANCCA|nr:hypothetical protein ANCCAN_00337 [Ancylostoma caninum]